MGEARGAGGLWGRPEGEAGSARGRLLGARLGGHRVGGAAADREGEPGALGLLGPIALTEGVEDGLAFGDRHPGPGLVYP